MPSPLRRRGPCAPFVLKRKKMHKRKKGALGDTLRPGPHFAEQYRFWLATEPGPVVAQYGTSGLGAVHAVLGCSALCAEAVGGLLHAYISLAILVSVPYPHFGLLGYGGWLQRCWLHDWSRLSSLALRWWCCEGSCCRGCTSTTVGQITSVLFFFDVVYPLGVLWIVAAAPAPLTDKKRARAASVNVFVV